jgi:hypothetical protein
MFAISYYYCEKSSGLLRRKKQLIKFLKAWGVISVIMILGMGIIIIVRTQLDKTDILYMNSV